MLYIIKEYLTLDGKNPFRIWLDTIAPEVRARIQARIFRLELGNLGDYKSIGHGLLELRLDFGPGYRIYLAFEAHDTVILLFAGSKKLQRRDIIKAKQFWFNYKLRGKNGAKKR